MIFRRLAPYQVAVDLSAAFLLGVVGLVLSDGVVTTPFVVLGMTVTFALRRLSPGLALTLAWLVAASQMITGSTPGVTNLAICAVLYSTAAYGTNRVKWSGLVSVGVGALLGTFYLSFVQQSLFGVDYDIYAVTDVVRILLQLGISLLGFLALLGLPWAGGLLARARWSERLSREARLIAERETARAENDAARAEREAARAERDIAVEQERNRIARDMHDVVAHSLAVVIAQADGARYAARVDPTSVDGALTTIATTAREALGDVRVLLGQLRHSQGEAPQPALGDLDRLLDQMRGSGLTVDLLVTGEPQVLGTNRQLAVFRIVQESLTNVLRHGAVDQPVGLHFDWRYEALHLVISNVVRPPTRPLDTSGDERRGGHGLDGMRERATLAGGSLTTQNADGRFVVHAIVPTLALTQEVRIR
ncbi:MULTISPECIES: sensor histidine kinase [Frigoribacterium]|uniref:sensor histidine kinase n=1 Tax=Frigoribacterium TaxID=96492 RepID=UPI000F48EBBC|nr:MULTISPECIES: histidine kinase [Frigoribacterium]MBD8485443.1 sensor histidine kinase [Frigoribacterium sp. CFBP 8759]NQW86136.1 sensor histidine kinase [Frigoribacterium sp. VKM Ac-2860]NQX07468.1 sensor histidine kinase [Frigoribacterium sp. VKM Ac-2859]MBD8140527.1 sensor histidine kinase [Frigoribacterium sp. CFBP 13605]ROS56856.1 signal transduction histidine kinase [Frigoribacterium sp. PhB118]